MMDWEIAILVLPGILVAGIVVGWLLMMAVDTDRPEPSEEEASDAS